MRRIAQRQGSRTEAVLLGRIVAGQILAPLQGVYNAEGRRRIQVGVFGNVLQGHAGITFHEEVEDVEALFQGLQ